MNIYFQTQKTIHFREADPAGIMFFANIYDFAHDAFEAFILNLKSDWNFWFKNPEFIFPLRSTQADYRAPLLPGHSYDILIALKHIGDSSFTVQFQFKSLEKIHAVVEHTHTFINPNIMKKTAIPQNIRELLTPYLIKEDNT